MEQVFIAGCDNYEQDLVTAAVEQLFSLMTPSEVCGKKVLVKPNLLMGASPESAVTTHPAVAFAVARHFENLGAQVIIAESGGQLYDAASLKAVYKKCGYSPLCDKYLNYDTKTFTKVCADGIESTQFTLIAPAVECDMIVSVAKLKTHGLTRFSCAVKNMFGTVPGLIKPTYHARLPRVEDFCEMIVDLCETVRPCYSIIDGIIGMEGNGPSGGTPKQAGVLLASENPYALDTAACRMIGIPPSAVYTNAIAKRRGLYDEFEILGDVKSCPRFAMADTHKGLLSMLFGKAPFKKKRKQPVISERCAACGACVKICPKDTIVQEGKQVRIEPGNCILCYCCHEFCPYKAIDFKPSKK